MSRLVSVAVLGAPGHGRTTLIQAIALRQAHRLGGKAPPALHGAPAVWFRTAVRQYELLDSHPAHAFPFRSLVVDRPDVELGVLVVDATSGPTPWTRAGVRVARWLGIEEPIVFLSKVDQCPRADSLDLAEYETRRMLAEHGFRADELPIVRGNAGAVLGLQGEDGVCACVDELLDILDRQPVLTPDPVGSPFLLAVEDVFSIFGIGTIVTGRIERGKVRPGDQVEVVGLRQQVRQTVITGVEQFAKTMQEGVAGENVGLLLRGVRREDVARGRVLAAPGSIGARRQFEAKVMTLSREEGGREAALFPGISALFAFRTATTGGTIFLPAGVETCLPGRETACTVGLADDLALEVGQRFLVFSPPAELIGFGEVTGLL